MKCPVCNQDNGPGVNFCEGCGRKIPRCPTCGLELTCRDRFCSNDRTRLSDDLLLLVPEESVLQAPVWSKPAAPAPAPASEPQYTPATLEDEGTVKAAPVPVQAGDSWSEPFGEETVRVTPVSGGRGPSVRNSDPVNVAAWDQAIPAPEPPKRAFCEDCGKRIAVGQRFCADCQRARTSRSTNSSGKKTGKVILAIILVILLLLGLSAGGYALWNSELFDWDTSSNRAEKEKDDDDADEDEDDNEDNADDAGQETPDVIPEDTSAGVVDPVDTQPSAAETTPTETTAPAATETVPPPEAVSDPLMYWIENCDKMYLSEEDLDGFDKQMCVYARNAIFAKSGRMFNSTELQRYFAQFDWYHPTVSPNNFSQSMFNAYQNANLNLILEYERDHGFN